MRGRRAPGGFVLLIVLAIIGVLTLLVATQLDLLRQQSTVGLRADESARARALAQGCLQYLEGYAYDRIYGSAPPPSDDEAAEIEGYAPVDFDEVLSPGGDVSQRYVPPIGETVFMPTGQTDLEHRYKLIRMNGGGCLVRFDDNSDDAIPGSQLGYFVDPTTGNAPEDDPDEGSGNANRGVDRTYKDRDGAIVMTAIGLYPVHDNTGAPQSYGAAHARVTLRRVLSARRSGYEGALLSGRDVDISGNARVCGYGGVQAPNLSLGGSACACGLLDIPGSLTPSDPVRGTCACGGASCAQTQVRRPAGDAPSFGSADYQFWGRSTFRLSDATTAEVGDAQCSLYFTSTGKVFMWDRSDNNAKSPGWPVDCHDGASCEAPGPHNCAPYVYADDGDIEAPCSLRGDSLGNRRMDCAGEQTPCWKPIADLDPSGYGDGDGVWFDNDPLTPNLHAEWDDDGSERRLSVRRDVRVPNLRNDRYLGIDGNPGRRRACGAADTCRDCDGRNGAFEYESARVWKTVSSSGERSLPAPAYFIMATEDGEVQLDNVGAENDLPARVSFSVRGDLTVTGRSGICGFRSRSCSEFPLATCTELTADNTDTVFPFHIDWRGPDRTVNDDNMLSAIAIQATGKCTVRSSGVLGGLSCGAIELRNSACVYGDLLTMRGSYPSGGEIECPCGGSQHRNGICLTGGRPLVVGMVDTPGDVCATSSSNARLEWGIYSGGKVTLAGSVKAMDYVVGYRGISMRDQAIVTFNETTAGAFAATKVRTYQEAPW